jgi:hypothetical protein
MVDGKEVVREGEGEVDRLVEGARRPLRTISRRHKKFMVCPCARVKVNNVLRSKLH